jgi:hypothetical protein
MSTIGAQDSRHYFMLPQAPEDAGYYTYGKLDGKPSHGAFQYAHPTTLSSILRVEREWQAIDNRRFGIGDISLAGGPKNKDHESHMSGLEIDVRPLRKDGLELPVHWFDSEYDQHATAKLIELFRLFAPIVVIYFNGPDIPFVRKRVKHDNHFHVQVRG